MFLPQKPLLLATLLLCLLSAKAGAEELPASYLPLPVPGPETEQMLAMISAEREPVTEDVINIHFHSLPKAEFAGFIIALEKGFYSEAGLPSVNLQWPDSPDNPYAFSLNARTPFCVKSLSLTIEPDTEHDVIRIAQLFQRSDLAIIARADSGIEELSDLKNKIFQSSDGDALINLNMFLAEMNITPRGVYPLGQNPTPLLNGLVDACIMDYFDQYNTLLQRAVRPEELRIFRLYEYGLGLPSLGINTLPLYWQNNERTCQAVVEATLKGYYYAFTHQEETLDRVMAYMERHKTLTNRSHQAWMLEQIYQAFTYRVGPDPRQWGYLSEDDYARAADYLLGTNAKNRPPINAFFRPPPRFWDETAEGKILPGGSGGPDSMNEGAGFEN